ncbi:MAG: LapA family protein [Alphaproteobacteria bacterium]|nr:LapA family protein [Alphaproteobacteria bacterium]
MMNFIRRLIGIPLIVVVIVFAVVNNDFATFTLKPFDVDITISLSVLILVLFFAGYLLGRLDGYVANAPLRSSLRAHKKTNKVLNKEHEKLHATVSDLQENIEYLKNKEPEKTKVPFKQKMSKFFSFKKNQQ